LDGLISSETGGIAVWFRAGTITVGVGVDVGVAMGSNVFVRLAEIPVWSPFSSVTDESNVVATGLSSVMVWV
jgi:hypothetical protein